MNNQLVKAAKELLHLHLCEQEGLSSGRPTREQWLTAVDNLSEALSQYTQQGEVDGSFLNVLIENYEAAKRGDEDDFFGTTKKQAVLETYADLIEIFKSNYWQASQPKEDGESIALKAWLSPHGVDSETDEQTFILTGYLLREVYFGGKIHGYPECCIQWNLEHAIKRTDKEKIEGIHTHNYNGFVPCPRHQKMIESGNIKPEQLIKHRLVSSPKEDAGITEESLEVGTRTANKIFEEQDKEFQKVAGIKSKEEILHQYRQTQSVGGYELEFFAKENIFRAMIEYHQQFVTDVDSIRVSAARDRLKAIELEREVAELKKLLDECGKKLLPDVREDLNHE